MIFTREYTVFAYRKVKINGGGNGGRGIPGWSHDNLRFLTRNVNIRMADSYLNVSGGRRSDWI